MATYNGARFLSEQLQSLSQQTRIPDELVVCDDGSTDDTLEIVSEYAESAPFPVHLHRNRRRLGFADNFFRAATLCHGNLIAFCDQDDVWLGEKLERCERAFDDHTQLVVHASSVVDENGRSLGYGYPRIKRTRSYRPLRHDPWFFIPGLCQVFRADLLYLAPWQQRPISQDLDGHKMDHDEWITFVASLAGRTVMLRDRLSLYRQHASQAAGAPASKGLLQQARSSLQQWDFAFEYHSRAASLLRGYAYYLENDVAQHSDPSYGDRVAAGVRFYRRCSQLTEKRATVYRPGEDRRRRAKGVGELIVRRGYRSRRSGGVGHRALLKDIQTVVLG